MTAIKPENGAEQMTKEDNSADIETKKNHDVTAKELPELKKYWQTVKDNPSDFTGWTYLLQYVEQENNLAAAREAFDAFLKHYPYCYGYWKKYADMEKKLNTSEKAEEVFERGLKAIALSVDLWVHYINFYKAYCKDDPNSQDKIKMVFERAIATSGQEFRSDRLWDQYINWQQENNNLKDVTLIYDKILSTPTQLYSHHFEKFQEHIKSHMPKDVLSTDEFFELRQQFVSQNKKTGPSEAEEEGETADDAMPPGVEAAPPGMESGAASDKDKTTDEETKFLRDKVIEKRKEIYSLNEAEVGRRWNYEEGIKRPYFHVKPLERAQLKNWREYLDYEIQNSSHERIVVLFERCMIACALYEDMWMKYARYAERLGEESVRDVYRRACTIHLQRKPNINLAWAAFEERHANHEEAHGILLSVKENIPDLLEATLRRINLERRLGNQGKVEELYRQCIAQANSTHMASHFAVKFSRYLYKIRGEFDQAIQVLKEAVERDPTNPHLHMQLVDIGFQRPQIDETGIVEVFDLALSSEMNLDEKIIFSQRKLEFLEDFGSDATKIYEAFDEYNKFLRSQGASIKKRPPDASEDVYNEKKMKLEVNGAGAAASAVPAQQDAGYAYSQQWANYPQTAYNYQQAWGSYPASYYQTH